MKFLILTTLVALIFAAGYRTVKYDTATTDPDSPCFAKTYMKFKKGVSYHASERWTLEDGGDWKYDDESCSEGMGFDKDGKYYSCEACGGTASARAEGETLSGIKCY